MIKMILKNCLAVFILAGLAKCTPGKKQEPSEKLETDGIDQAIMQDFRMTRDPFLNTVPRERLEAAKMVAQSMQTARALRPLALTWTERGPNNIGGRTRAILVDRADASGNTALAASVSGGIFKTTNFLAPLPNWVPVNDRMSNLVVTAMVQDRTNPAIMYAGTGEGWFNIDALKGGGVFKSIDGGSTWNLLPSTSNFEFVQDIDQDLNGNVYVTVRNNSAAGARGVQRSTN